MKAFLVILVLSNALAHAEAPLREREFRSAPACQTTRAKEIEAKQQAARKTRLKRRVEKLHGEFPEPLTPATQKWVGMILFRLMTGSELHKNESIRKVLGANSPLIFFDPDLTSSVSTEGICLNLEHILGAQSEDEVAFLLAHELAHYLLCHLEVEEIDSEKYDSHELEADQLALEILTGSYNLQAGSALLEKLFKEKTAGLEAGSEALRQAQHSLDMRLRAMRGVPKQEERSKPPCPDKQIIAFYRFQAQMKAGKVKAEDYIPLDCEYEPSHAEVEALQERLNH